MNPEVKARWVAALRSGEYKQGRSALTEIKPNGNATHCCLGVLCEILPEIKATRTVVSDAYATLVSYGAAEPSTLYLPPDAVKAAGLDQYNPLVTLPNGRRVTLTYLNDRPWFTFAQIADVIEASL